MKGLLREIKSFNKVHEIIQLGTKARNYSSLFRLCTDLNVFRMVLYKAECEVICYAQNEKIPRGGRREITHRVPPFSYLYI